jgi:hypothetical protein
MIVTFLYRIKGSSQRGYGKYIGKCPVYEEGLDRALAELLLPLFRQQYDLIVTDVYDLSIGVLSVDRDAKDYYSEEEKDVFDLLYCQWSTMPTEIFFAGLPVKVGQGV